MLGRLIVVGAILTGLAGCDSQKSVVLGGACSEALRSLPKDPVTTADKAIEAGDLRLVAVNGYSQWTPGASDRQLREKHGILILEKTSDTPPDASCQKYQEAATSYAELYNHRILERAKKASGKTPAQ